MLSLVLFIAFLGSAFAQIDVCRDTIYEDCLYPSVIQELEYIYDIADCADYCNAYYCEMFRFNPVDEICTMYEFDSNITSVQDFQASCNVIATATDDCVSFEDTCQTDDLCPSCTACGYGTCGGYMNSDCQVYFPYLLFYSSYSIRFLAHQCSFSNCLDITSSAAETFESDSFDFCKQFCNSYYNFAVYNKETRECQCYETVERECETIVVGQGTDYTNCS